MSSNLRFSHRSPCDYMMFDGEIFYTLELKSFDGACSFERTKDDNGIIHWYQVDSLKKFATYKNVCSGFILDFRKTDHTYFLNINDWDNLINSINKKSFNESDMCMYCNPLLIDKKRLKINYRYDVDKFLCDVKVRQCSVTN